MFFSRTMLSLGSRGMMSADFVVAFLRVIRIFRSGSREAGGLDAADG